MSGIKTLIVSQVGVVYGKDLGLGTLHDFRTMERYNPDATWTAIAAP